MLYFDQILHAYAYQHCLTTGMFTGMFTALFDGRDSAEHVSGRLGQLVKMLITLGPLWYSIFGSSYFNIVMPHGTLVVLLNAVTLFK